LKEEKEEVQGCLCPLLAKMRHPKHPTSVSVSYNTFGQRCANLVKYCVIWSKMRQFGQKLRHLVKDAPFGQRCANLVKDAPFGQRCAIWSKMRQFGQIWSKMRHLVKDAPIWSNMVKDCDIWSKMRHPQLRGTPQ
jgi:hypothetical protein